MTGDNTNPYSYVISANIQRRHLTPELKHKLIADVLKARPEQSSRAVAEQTKSSHNGSYCLTRPVLGNGSYAGSFLILLIWNP